MAWYDGLIAWFGDPHLTFITEDPPPAGMFQARGPIDWHERSAAGFDVYKAFRVPVLNRRWGLRSRAAQGCQAWLQLDGHPEAFQVCWVGNHPTVAINVGTPRDVDLLSYDPQRGEFVAPTENGYLAPRPRRLGPGPLTGTLRVSSENGSSIAATIRAEAVGAVPNVGVLPDERI